MVTHTTESVDNDALNDAQPWDDFNPVEYTSHNYHIVSEEDHELLKRTRDYFAEVVKDRPLHRLHGIDLGAGPNLYPSLAMLPFCKKITLAERGEANRQWLTEQISREKGYDGTWDQFWEILRASEPYNHVKDPRHELRTRARVRDYNVLKPDEERWNIGTMFFVAESITTSEEEFQDAARNFVKILRARAPFAAAFMRQSSGYTVDGHHFPAVAVDKADIEGALTSVADIDEIIRIRFNPHKKLREGYEGMILALGRARKNS